MLDSDIQKLASDINADRLLLDNLFRSAIDLEKLTNYFAEIGETSVDNVTRILNHANISYNGTNSVISIIVSQLNNVTELEIERTLLATIRADSFIQGLLSITNIGLDELLPILYKGSLEFVARRFEVFHNSLDVKIKDDIHQPVSTFNHTDNQIDLTFSNGRIDFVGFASPPQLTSAERINVIKQWYDFTIQQIQKETLPSYKGGIKDYYENFIQHIAPKIDDYIINRFGDKQEIEKQTREEALRVARSRIKYVIAFGIGGNEMRWHLLEHLNNQRLDTHPTWISLNNAAQIDAIPDDANSNNTIRFSASRGGNSEETKASEEILFGRFPHSIVCANSGELLNLGIDHNAMIVPFPHRIAGRFAGLKTPINLIPMYLCGMDIQLYWEASARADQDFDFQSSDNLPCKIAKFIYFEKMLRGINILYLGQNKDAIARSLQELSQHIMEGLGKEESKIGGFVGMSFPRNSHYEIEGPLGNPNMYLFWNFIESSIRRDDKYQYKFARDAQKRKLYADQVNIALCAANLVTFAKTSPSIVILFDKVDLEVAAYLSKIYEDTIYILCRLFCVDPFGNPRVKQVRDESTKNIEKLFRLFDNNIRDSDFILELIKANYLSSNH